MNNILRSALIAAGILVLAACSQQSSEEQTQFVDDEAKPAQGLMADQRPNILIIMADDLGYSDIQPYGGEIATPNLDALANNGVTFTNFHSHTMCTPTRAMLLTGVNNHSVGVATMAAEQRGAQKGAPGYEAYLRPDVTLIPELLQQAGYQTFISGKWDLGGRKDDALLPDKRGFDRSFVLVEGSADNFRNFPALAELPNINYRYDGAVYELPEDFYSTDAYTEKMLEFLDKRDIQKPFFGFLSYTAPHYPLQAKDADIAKYEGVYDVGYQKIIDNRLTKMKEQGLLKSDIKPAPFHETFTSWDGLSEIQKQFESRRMQVYAAMTDSMDQSIGKVVAKLKEQGLLDNTLIVFMSDNGPEGANPLDWAEYYNDWAIESFDMSLENLGKPNSFAWTGPGWALVSSMPHSMFKGFTYEGGTRVPAIFHWPKGIKTENKIQHAFGHVLDLPATFLELAETGHPGTETAGFENRKIEGKTLLPVLEGTSESVYTDSDAVVWEMLDRRAVRKGDWKLVWVNKPWGKGLGNWALFNLANDPTEINDVSEANPEIVAELTSNWSEYVKNNGLILLPEGIDMRWTNVVTHYDYVPMPDTYMKKLETQTNE